MAVFRVERTHNYTVMSNYHLRDKGLSLKAKGLLSQMLSLPEDWDYTLAGLAKINAEGRDAIRAAVQELEQAGYIRRSRVRDDKGCLRGTEYVIYERPQQPDGDGPESPAGDVAEPLFSPQPALEEPAEDAPALENPTLGDTTQLNIDKTNPPKNKILTSQSTDSFPFPSAPPVVVTSSASLASPQAAKLTRSAVPPLPTKTASLGFRGDPKVASTAAQPPEAKGRKRMRCGRMSKDEMDAYREMIRENIDYDNLVRERPYDAGQLDEMVELMVEAVCSKKEMIRVAGNNFPQAVVKSRLLKLDSEHIRFVFDCLKENTTQVRNMKQYLLTVLYNALATIENHYAAQVNHDLWGKKMVS